MCFLSALFDNKHSMIKKIILLLLFNLPLFAQEEQTIKLLF